MKTLKIIAVALVLLAAAAAGAQTMGSSAGHDLDALWAQAQKTYKTAQEDAIILLDSRTVTVGDEGTVVTRVHQVVWIATSRGIRDYADLRVPWDSATSTFEVEKLRTWMGGRWWPDAEQISDTAVVETLPYAVALADDYTTLRETMLLHDGVELPCIMETAYTIAVQGPPTAGADDVFVVPQRDPVVRSEYVVRVPVGIDVKFASLNGAPEPVVSENGVRELAWTMEGVGALRLPVTEQPEAYEPAIVWTTWPSWEALLREFQAAVEAAAVLDEALADSVAAAVRGVPEGFDRTMAAIRFADAAVRGVHTDFLPWRLAPRAAVRTWRTGYGHALDKAVLVSALVRAAQPQVQDGEIVLHRHGFGEVAPDLPRMADLDGLTVRLMAPGGGMRYDPASGVLQGATGGYGTVAPPQRYVGASSQFVLDLSLEPGEAEWTGTGTLNVSGGCFDWPGLLTGETPYAEAVESALAGVLGEVTVAWARPTATMAPSVAAVRFGLSLPAPAVGEDGRCRFAVGTPSAGLLRQLPRDIRVADGVRQSPVRLATGGVQKITVRVRHGAWQVAGSPAAVVRANEAGEFRVEARQDGGWLTVTRRLALDPAGVPAKSGVVVHPAQAWPHLRALLLEETDPANGTIVLQKD